MLIQSFVQFYSFFYLFLAYHSIQKINLSRQFLRYNNVFQILLPTCMLLFLLVLLSDSPLHTNGISGVIVRVLALNAVNRGFEPGSCQDCEIDNCCISNSLRNIKKKEQRPGDSCFGNDFTHYSYRELHKIFSHYYFRQCLFLFALKYEKSSYPPQNL